MKFEWNDALNLEREVAVILQLQAETGVYFDVGKAHYYVDHLDELKDEEYLRIRPYLTPVVAKNESKLIETTDKDESSISYTYVKKITNKDGSYTKSVTNCYPEAPEVVEGPFSRIEIYEPKLSEKANIINILLKSGWKPKIFTDTGIPKLTEKGEPVETLEKVGDFGKNLGKWYTLSHRQSQINGLIDNVREDDRISAGFSGITNTYRHKHRTVANIPRPTSVFGTEMRSLFRVAEGRSFIGADVSGLELRMLAHYMNDKEYIDQILSGDIHLYNLSKTGNYILKEGSVDLNNLSSEKKRLKLERETAKTFCYGWLYGAGNAKIGSIIGGSAGDGEKLKLQFLNSLPSLSLLLNKVKRIAENNKAVPAIDGRPLRIREFEGKLLIHTAINCLLQGSGSIVTKRAMVIANNEIKHRRLDAKQIIFYHDELGYDSHPDCSKEVSEILLNSMRLAGEYYKLRIPIDGEVGIGENWSIH